MSSGHSVLYISQCLPQQRYSVIDEGSQGGVVSRDGMKNQMGRHGLWFK
jgi:hypothetical protein